MPTTKPRTPRAYRFYVSDGEGDTCTLAILEAETDDTAMTLGERLMSRVPALQAARDERFAGWTDDEADGSDYSPYVSVVVLETLADWEGAIGDLHPEARTTMGWLERLLAPAGERLDLLDDDELAYAMARVAYRTEQALRAARTACATGLSQNRSPHFTGPLRGAKEPQMKMYRDRAARKTAQMVGESLRPDELVTLSAADRFKYIGALTKAVSRNASSTATVNCMFIQMATFYLRVLAAGDLDAGTSHSELRRFLLVNGGIPEGL